MMQRRLVAACRFSWSRRCPTLVFAAPGEAAYPSVPALLGQSRRGQAGEPSEDRAYSQSRHDGELIHAPWAAYAKGIEQQQVLDG